MSFIRIAVRYVVVGAAAMALLFSAAFIVAFWVAGALLGDQDLPET